MARAAAAEACGQSGAFASAGKAEADWRDPVDRAWDEYWAARRRDHIVLMLAGAVVSAAILILSAMILGVL